MNNRNLANSYQNQLSANRTEASTNLTTIFSEIEKKDAMERLAWKRLEENLNSEMPNPKFIELILKPKFPTMNVNVNAELDGLSPDDLIAMIEKI